MKVLCIGDIHGRDDWKDKVNYALTHFVNKIIFIADYVDSFDIDPCEILYNLKEIIEYKKKYPEKIILLLGNHDYAYVFGYSNISGYNYTIQYDYKQLFQENWDLFDIAWVILLLKENIHYLLMQVYLIYIIKIT